jgi:DNA-binding MarR family transcriptional regulator
MTSSTDCAEQVLLAIPPLVRALWQHLQEATPTAVTPAQFGLLTLLRQEPLTSTEMAHKWGVSAPTMSKMTHLLVEHGWVAREEDPTDRRRKILSLTPGGLELQGSIYGAVCQRVASSLADLSAEEQANITSALGLLLARLT